MEKSIEQQMQGVKEKALVCPDCRLSETRTQVVFGEGNPQTQLVLVGEGPGEQEDKSGRPFVGRAGNLLAELLEEVQLQRENLWITNIIKCRAYTNETGRTRNRPPRADEIRACRQWIDAELNLIEPAVIICIGAPAANSLIHKNFKITEERGQWFTDSPYAPSVMAVLHPAYLLRQHGEEYKRMRQLLIDDLNAAKKRVAENQQRQQLTLF
jgi:DNA polymerase